MRDTHWPWNGEDIDEGALVAPHEQYLQCGIRSRDDTGYMRSIDPSYQAISPRW
jgi:glucarate dehydratase